MQLEVSEANCSRCCWGGMHVVIWHMHRPADGEAPSSLYCPLTQLPQRPSSCPRACPHAQVLQRSSSGGHKFKLATVMARVMVQARR